VPDPPRVPSTARHYAQAIFELAEEETDFSLWQQRLERVRQLLEATELDAALGSPELAIAQKLELCRALLERDRHLDKLAGNLLLVLVSSQRQRLLPAIQEGYRQLVDRRQGRVLAQLTTAVPLSAADQAWLREGFVGEGLLAVGDSMANLARIVDRVRARSPAPILIYNVSAVVPGDQVHAYDGLDETFSTRIRRFNLGLVELSQQTGISIVDVDAIVARGGADRMKIDALHLTAEGCRAVAEEVVRVLDDLGALPEADAR